MNKLGNILESVRFFLFILCSVAVMSCDAEERFDTGNMDRTEEEVDEEFKEVCRLISGRIKDDNLPARVSAVDLNVAKWLELIAEDGSFGDIDYKSTAEDWPAKKHLDRLKEITQSYVTEGGAYSGKDEIYTHIENALSYWIKMRPVCSNWYHNQISSPQSIGEIMVMLRYGVKTLPEDLEAAIFDYWEKTGGDPADQSGANETDIALHWLYRGCLQESKSTLQKAVFHSFRPLDFVNPNNVGLQYDMSFFQHGPQLYIGGYGSVMLDGITKVATYVTGTDYGMTRNQLYNLYRFVDEVYVGSTVRGSYQFYNVAGRSVSRDNALNVRGFANRLELMKSIDTEHEAIYQKRIGMLRENKFAGIEKKLYHYYIGDYMAIESEGYSACVRLSSKRTRRCENGNNENLKSYFMSDGSTVVSTGGDEYFNIFPVWDWNRIPGVTNPYMASIPVAAAWGELGESDFAGGLTDGSNGLSAMKSVYRNHGVNMDANKSYFFIGDKIVCVGSGITSTMSVDVNTTVEQSIKYSNAYYSVNNTENTLQNENTVSADIDWLWHNNIAYIFPDNMQVNVAARKQSGSWRDINRSQSGTTVEKNVLSVWFNHGIRPSGGGYVYIIAPGMDKNLIKDHINDIEILSRTDDVHAITDGNGLYQVVFYNKGILRAGDLSIEADSPCALMLQKSGENAFRFYYSDPSHKLINANVKIGYKGKTVENTLSDFAGDNVYKGRTHNSIINFN